MKKSKFKKDDPVFVHTAERAWNLWTQLARDVLSVACGARMPDSYWLTDQRILRACEVLGITPQYARDHDWPVDKAENS